ncbi:hypothetical protein A244_19661, partial [Pseudomonas syringae pv. actinidiae ICMP 18807]
MRIAVRKAAAEDHQRVAGQHGVVTRAETDKAGHADIERVVVFDVLLAAQGVNDGCAQRVGKRED